MRLKVSPGGIAAAVMSLLPAAASAQIAPPPVAPAPETQLRPHIAVYDMTLHSAVPGSNVSDVRGRMVYSFRGSPCAGYTLTNRLVTQITDRDGKSATSDMRSSSWEQAQGGQLRFASAQYLDRKLSERAAGHAERGGESGNLLEVQMDKPDKHKVTLAGQPLFPTQHSQALIEAARAGRRQVQTALYDGSDSGAKMLETTAVIGNMLPADANKQLPRAKNAEQLDDVPSWPVSIAYFDTTTTPQSDQGLPKYELSFRLYANGVSRKLQIDYGNFSIDGELQRVEFFEPAKCPAPGEAAPAPVSLEDAPPKATKKPKPNAKPKRKR